MVRLCSFRDHDPWHKPDDTGMNKVGFVTDADNVIYPLRMKLVERPLKTVSRRKLFRVYERQSSSELTQRIRSFFENNAPNPLLFNRAVGALIKPGGESFFDDPIKLPRLQPISREEWEARWNTFVLLPKPGDLIQVFDSESTISTLIARFDNGTWSHSASYVGDGRICESITSGVVERAIESYKAPRYRLGLYRAPGLTDSQAESLCSRSRSQVDKPYAWGKVTALALRKLLGIAIPFGVPRYTSPNDMVAGGNLTLMFVV